MRCCGWQNNTRCSPSATADIEGFQTVLKHSKYFHGKFYHIGEDCIETTIPYEKLLQLVVASGFEGTVMIEYNDSCAKAAQVAQQMIAFADTGNRVFYNHGSDYLSQYFDADGPLVGAIGLLTKDGVAKPVYYVFQFFHRLYARICAKGKTIL